MYIRTLENLGGSPPPPDVCFSYRFGARCQQLLRNTTAHGEMAFCMLKIGRYLAGAARKSGEDNERVVAVVVPLLSVLFSGSESQILQQGLVDLAAVVEIGYKAVQIPSANRASPPVPWPRPRRYGAIAKSAQAHSCCSPCRVGPGPRRTEWKAGRPSQMHTR